MAVSMNQFIALFTTFPTTGDAVPTYFQMTGPVNRSLSCVNGVLRYMFCCGSSSTDSVLFNVF